MIVTDQPGSQRLQKDLPPTITERLAGLGVHPGEVWLRLDADLNHHGEYGRVWLLATPTHLISLPEDSDGQIRHFAREELNELRTRQGVGGGFLEAIVEGVYVDIVSYSNARSDDFSTAVSKLQKWRSGEDVQVGPKDDEDPRRCPTCGTALQFKGDVCQRCVQSRAVLVRTFRLMKPYKWLAAAMLALVLANNGLALVPTYLTRALVDRVLMPAPPSAEAPADADAPAEAIELLPEAPPASALQAESPGVDPAKIRLLGKLVGALLGLLVLRAGLQGVLGRIASRVGTQVAFDMKNRVFAKLSELSVDYFDRYSTGQLINRVASDTEQMKGFVQQFTGGLISETVMVIAVTVVMMLVDWRLALFALLPAPFVVLGSIFFWRRVYPRYFRVWDANSKLHGALNSILSGIKVVKSFGQENRERKRFAQSTGYVRDSFRSVEYTTAMFNPTMGLIFQMGGLLVWFAGGRWVLQGELTPGVLLQFLGLTGMFYMPLGHLTQLTNWLTSFLTAAQRTFEILDTPVQIAQADKPVALKKPRGHIVFENVTFGYDHREPVLKGVSFEIAPGERIGVVGKSGSGKTTIINLLSRFYDVDQGRILIDGHDIRQIDKGDLHRQVGVVLQEPFLFRGTIYENLTYGRADADPEMLTAAAKAAHCHEFIMRQPLGYDTYIGDRGAGLSGGEKQRISISRALLYDPAVLILDEATSSVDTESEKLIQEALLRATAGRTTIAVAHRLSTLKNSDRIFVVDSGQIAESGSHEELLALGGIYYTLVKIQTELSSEPGVDALAAQK